MFGARLSPRAIHCAIEAADAVFEPGNAAVLDQFSDPALCMDVSVAGHRID
jgi:hypothetical protein